MPDTRAIASLNRQTKGDEERRRWAVEQAVLVCTRAPFQLTPITGNGETGGVAMPPTDVIGLARRMDDFVCGRTTT